MSSGALTTILPGLGARNRLGNQDPYFLDVDFARLLLRFLSRRTAFGLLALDLAMAFPASLTGVQRHAFWDRGSFNLG